MPSRLRTERGFAVFAKLLLLVGAAACGPAELVPAAGPNDASNMERAVGQTKNNVRLIAQAVEWPGEAWISSDVTPLRVIIENHSGRPLRVRYSDFTLLSDEGNRYAALPPFDVEGAATVRREYGPIAPVFEYNNFYTAPQYGGIYTGVGVYPGAFSMQPGYTRHYYDAWDRVELPTAEMLELALPAGVLQDNGRIAGWLYFQKVDKDERSVDLRVSLESAENGEPVAAFVMPFIVD